MTVALARDGMAILHICNDQMKITRGATADSNSPQHPRVCLLLGTMQAIRRAHALRRAVVAATSRSARSAALWRAAAPATRFEPACGVRSARTGLWSVRGLSTTAATRGAAEFPRSDLFSHAAFEADAAATASCDRVVFRTQAQAEQETGLSLDAGSVALAQQPRGASEPLLLVANVGKIAKDADEAAVSAQLRKAATAAVQWLARHQRTSVAVEFPPDVGLAPEDAAGVVTQVGDAFTTAVPGGVS